uniref:Cytochrome b-c1 complex subunit 8 n=1 Tax=Capra hircus TaxID=9925 RepID=A0A8C2PG10_CAPHI
MPGGGLKDAFHRARTPDPRAALEVDRPLALLLSPSDFGRFLRLRGKPGTEEKTEGIRWGAPRDPRARPEALGPTPEQAPPTSRHAAGARLFGPGGYGAVTWRQSGTSSPGSDLTASWRGVRSYRKWRTEAGGSRGVVGEVTSVCEWGRIALSRGPLEGGVAFWVGRMRSAAEGLGLAAASPGLEPNACPPSVLQRPPRPWAASLGIPNVLRRTRACILRVAPPFVVFYLVYTWGTQEFEKSKRKNPAAYENDK